MSIVSGLDNIKSAVKRENYEDRREIKRLIPLEPGQSRKIRFVQELDKNAKNYREEYGLGLVVVERNHPDNTPYGQPGGKLWWLRLVDRTEDDGRDWAAEQGWDLRTTLYINVVDVDTGEVLLFEKNAYSDLADDIFTTAGERGTLTDGVFKFSKGEGSKGRYSISAVDFTDEQLDVDPEELFDIENEILKNIPASEQEQFVQEIESRVYGADEEGEGVEDSDEVW